MSQILVLLRRWLSKEQRRFIKFCVVGTSGVPVNLLCTWLGYAFVFGMLDELPRKAGAYLLGIFVSIFTNFLLNDLWTWRDRQGTLQGFAPRLGKFYLVCSLASAIQFGTAMGLTIWLGLHYLLAQVVGIGLAMAINFLVNNAWTFRAHSPSSSRPASRP